jgi:hypothetical protein
MESKEPIHKVERGALATKGLTIQSTTVMVNDQAVAGLTIEALKATNPVTVR